MQQLALVGFIAGGLTMKTGVIVGITGETLVCLLSIACSVAVGTTHPRAARPALLCWPAPAINAGHPLASGSYT